MTRHTLKHWRSSPMDRIQRIRSLKEKNKPKTIQGPQGESGPQGVQGVQGERGDTGKQGEKGPKGDVGPKGSVGPRGNVGPKGEKGDTGAVGIVWLGAWGTLIEYKVNDAVSHIGQSYICIKAHKSGISTEPGVAVNWDKYWDIIAERGKKGPSGSQGPAGSGGSGEATPDATSTVKGKLQLANDLGGTADAPTTPTAVHITGDEYIEGQKTFAGDIVGEAGATFTGDVYSESSMSAPLISGYDLDIGGRMAMASSQVPAATTSKTLFGAITNTATSITLSSIFTGSPNVSNFSYPYAFVIEPGTANEEYFVAPTAPVSVGSNRGRFDNVIRGWAGTSAIAHSSAVACYPTNKDTRPHGYIFPNPNSNPGLDWFTDVSISDSHDPIQIFLPPRYAWNGMAAPNTNQIVGVLFEEGDSKNIEIIEPTSGDVLVTFTGTGRKSAMFLFNTIVGSYIPISVFGGS